MVDFGDFNNIKDRDRKDYQIYQKKHWMEIAQRLKRFLRSFWRSGISSEFRMLYKWLLAISI
jgi:hypothetical protein